MTRAQASAGAEGMPLAGHGYTHTRRASPELRTRLRNKYFVPGPMTDDEMADFALYLGAQGVTVTWSKKHPGNFSTDTDCSRYAYAWRVERREITRKDQS